ncbi:otopetrin-2-like isoform X2 [Zootermopsis nevadensis]|uniref:otopetrin-2-like isoform X2 n=1 Tax=Zootermopsis nevadensis TaxID=136037 RepID=UPI000B8EC13B|nr:otopetrin-2-like isoform X2 [Zootermopsis nevadensis]
MSDHDDNQVAVPLIEPHDMAVFPIQTSERRLSSAVVSVNNQQLLVVGLVEQATSRIDVPERDDEERSPIIKKGRFRMAENTLVCALSALYAKLLVVLGVAFPVTEGLAPQVPLSFYQGFYLYLYLGSITFMCFLYAMTLKERAVNNIISRHRRTGVVCQCPDSCYKKDIVRYGSFYLRLGAMGFGIGSMVYSGLEFGQYFARDSHCDDTVLVFRSATRMLLTLMQIQFMFLNNKDLKMGRYVPVARFGLMHMIATNLCEWLYVLVEETKHEIEHLSHYDHANDEEANETDAAFNTTELHRLRRGVPSHLCSRTNIVGMLVQKSSPYLFPCTVEYSLICAVTLYEMWKHIRIPPPIRVTHHVCSQSIGRDFSSNSLNGLRSAHHFTLDCDSSQKGLCAGILVLVLTIISLVLFLVLHNEENYVQLAVYEVSICEMCIYILCTLAVLACMVRIRVLPAETGHGLGLDNSLLVMAQAGMYVYCIFSIIGFNYAEKTDVPGGAAIEILALMQTTVQTILVLDASSRRCRTKADRRRKPGRELISFLLVANAAVWMINVMQKGHAEYSPQHLKFFGVWPWTVITHISMPLAIFYRFHSTICLFEIWKASYKLKREHC